MQRRNAKNLASLEKAQRDLQAREEAKKREAEQRQAEERYNHSPKKKHT